jgi:hypothetical protein
MAPGDSAAIWLKLHDALVRLAWLSDGLFAFVVDAGGCVWCLARRDSVPTVSTSYEYSAADRFYKTEIVPRCSDMRRAKRIDVAKLEGDDLYLATSFAGLYALVVWFGDPVDPVPVRARMERMLPQIETLTLALPPLGGPGGDEGAAKMRA